MEKTEILRQAVAIKSCKRQAATHFALCYDKKIRYLISINKGKKYLKRTIAAYSGKMGLMMRFINWIPFLLLNKIGLGYYVSAVPENSIDAEIKKAKCEMWNLIVGTYDEKQKLVFQCFKNKEGKAIFIKVGNNATQQEMNAEISFLKNNKSFDRFDIPMLIGYSLSENGSPFNIQITLEFEGKKTDTRLTQDIVDIYKEIAKDKKIVDGMEYEFSHGDFAPWNIRKNHGKYIVFDWENCDFRIKGFDLMHFAVVSRVLTEGQELYEAYTQGLSEIKQFIPDFFIDWQQFANTYCLLRLETR